MKRTLLYIIGIAAALTACDKVPQNEEPVQAGYIDIAVDDDIATRAPIYNINDLTGSGAKVYMLGMKGSAAISTYYNNAQITIDNTTSLWHLSDLNRESRWDYNQSSGTGYDYKFLAYGYNGTSGTDGRSLTVNTTTAKFGQNITVSEPSTYPASDGGLDYVFSQEFDVTTRKVGSAIRGDLVKLRMEHALALIEVRISVQKDHYFFRLKNIEIGPFFRTADMECVNVARYGSGTSNQWTVKNPKNTVTYSLSAAQCAEHTYTNDHWTENKDFLVFRFCAVPQQMSTTQLRVTYGVKTTASASENEIAATWDLKDFYDWEYGYHNIYTINVDASNKLVATIEDWPSVFNVSGTLLPRIEN